ncbi:lytic transglycosylase domain-containing protein [Thermocrinis sp.]
MKAIVFLLFLSTSSFAFYHCFFDAGKRYRVDPYLLVAIASVESGFNPRAINHNKDGSVDYGIMQINSHWLKKYRIPKDWIWEPCYNIHFGAMVLKSCIDRRAGNLKLAVDCYNKGDKAKENSEYVLKVYTKHAKVLKMIQ